MNWEKFSIGRILLNLAVFGLLGGIVYETFLGYSVKFDAQIATIFVFIEIAIMGVVMEMVKRKNHTTILSKAVMWLMIIIMTILTSYGLYGQVWKLYEKKFLAGTIASELSLSNTNLLNKNTDELGLLKIKIDKYIQSKDNLLERKRELTLASQKAMLEINSIIKSVGNCSLSVDCSIRKDMAIGQLDIIKNELKDTNGLIIDEMVIKNNLETKYNSKISEIATLKLDIQNQKQIAIDSENQRAVIGGNKETNKWLSIIISLVMYPIYIMLLFLKEHLSVNNVEYRRSQQVITSNNNHIVTRLKSDNKKLMDNHKLATDAFKKHVKDLNKIILSGPQAEIIYEEKIVHVDKFKYITTQTLILWGAATALVGATLFVFLGGIV